MSDKDLGRDERPEGGEARRKRAEERAREAVKRAEAQAARRKRLEEAQERRRETEEWGEYPRGDQPPELDEEDEAILEAINTELSLAFFAETKVEHARVSEALEYASGAEREALLKELAQYAGVLEAFRRAAARAEAARAEAARRAAEA